eukprot:2026468-Prymnesium_polylepis.1
MVHAARHIKESLIDRSPHVLRLATIGGGGVAVAENRTDVGEREGWVGVPSRIGANRGRDEHMRCGWGVRCG